MSHVIMSPM